MNFHSVDLYGGAIKCDVPTSFIDISDVRPVADNHEVFADKSEPPDGTDCVLRFELVDPACEGSSALIAEFHFRDEARTSGSEIIEVHCTDRSLGFIPLLASQLNLDGSPRVTHIGVAAGTQRIHKGRDPPGVTNDVAVVLTAIRFAPPASADLLISLSGACRIDPQSTSVGCRPVSKDEVELSMTRMLSSVTVLDWSLFA